MQRELLEELCCINSEWKDMWRRDGKRDRIVVRLSVCRKRRW